MADPKVTIILRSFNEGWALRETLSALRAQNYTAWDLIAFDSGSNDGSVDMLGPRYATAMQPASTSVNVAQPVVARVRNRPSRRVAIARSAVAAGMVLNAMRLDNL